MKPRIDTWTNKDDMLLVQTVIQGVAEGKTQLDCFEEVGEQIGRTAAACGFRWNKELRSQYKSAFESAQQVRKEAKSLRRAHREKQLEELQQSSGVRVRYVDPDFDEEWDGWTLNDNTQDAVILPKSRVQSQTVETRVHSLTGLTEMELIELDKILDLADSEILQGLRYDIKATLSR
jgi:hypothetical protein